MGRQQSRYLIKIVKKIFDILDIPMIYLSLYIAWWLRFESKWFEVTGTTQLYGHYQKTFWAISILWFIIFSLTGLYKNRARFGIEQIFYIVKTVIIATAAILAGAFFYREFSYSRLTLVLGLCSTTVMVSLFHLFKRQLKLFFQKRGYGIEKVLIIGSGKLALDCYKRINTEAELLGLKLCGICSDNTPIQEENNKSEDKTNDCENQSNCSENETNKLIPLLGKLKELTAIIEDHSIGQIYIALEPEKQEKTLEILHQLNTSTIDVKIVPNAYSIITSSIHISNIGGMPVVNLMPLSIHGTGGIVKAAIDRIGAFFGLILMLPVFALIALKIKKDSKGKVIYAQERIGRDGKSFTIYKFRSMKENAEDTTGPVWASVDDPRKTPFGEFIRKYSIDELPQLWNVFKGDMSLVGPRPERPFFVNQFEKEIPAYSDRHIIKTGMTGWAQVNGLRGQSPIGERTRYDIWYIENWSIWLDLVILVRTIHVCLFNPTGF